MSTALRTHLERLLPELNAYARSICERREDGEDMVQEAVTRALTAADPPGAIEELRPWMFRVVRNLRTDAARRSKVRRDYFEREAGVRENDVTRANSHEDMLVRMAFEALPPQTREILFLIDVMGLRYDEAASVLGVPRGTVMSRISRARRALRERIGGPDR